MIRIQRGPEPDDLRSARHQRLARAMLAREANKGALPKEYDFGGYELARKPLYEAQHRKCAYCERLTGLHELPTEHFRPKNGAARVRGATHKAGPGKWDGDAYWWLAWTWENLFFSCGTCNGQSHKGNYFPVAGTTLAVGSYDLSGENALLVDPSHEDPLLHVCWRPLMPSQMPRDQWEWAPNGLTSKGVETIWAYRLSDETTPKNSPALDDADPLLPQVTDILQRHIVRKVDKIEKLLEEGQKQEAEDAWHELLRDHLSPTDLFLGAKWSALTYLRDLPNAPLKQLPEPRRPGADPQPWVIPVGLPPAPAGIPDSAWVRLLANEQLDAALIETLRVKPCTVQQLWALLRRQSLEYQPLKYQPTKPALRAHLDGLVAAGSLRRQGELYLPDPG